MEAVRQYFSFFNKPSEKLLDSKAIYYCAPVFRDLMRITTALGDIEKNKICKVDITKWAITWIVSSQIQLPYIGTISTITTIAAIAATILEHVMLDPSEITTIPQAAQQ